MDRTPGGGCLSVGPRVRMESRVVAVAGFGPGIPVGAQGSLGARGEPGKRAFSLSTLRRFYTRAPEVTLEAGPRPAPPPPSSVGYTGSGGEPGFRFS